VTPHYICSAYARFDIRLLTISISQGDLVMDWLNDIVIWIESLSIPFFPEFYYNRRIYRSISD